MSGKCSVEEGCAQNSSIIKWKWFIQDNATWGMQAGDTHEQSLFSSRTDLELRKKLPDSITWTVPYK